MQAIRIDSIGITHLGLMRTNNEDVWAELPEEQFYILADGMGGHNAGEIAARETVAHLIQSIKILPKGSLTQVAVYLNQAIKDANAWVYNLSLQNPAYQGMGTTLCCVLIYENHLIYAHVGDSRIYRYRQGLAKLTVDHSLSKHVISRAIGTCPDVEPEISIASVHPEDMYLLCSDGLTDYMSDNEIHSWMKQPVSLERTAHALVEGALIRGGKDNITLMLVKVAS